MTTFELKIKKPAPLANVAAFSTLIERVVQREPDVPGLACFYGPSGYGKTRAAVFGANRHRAAYVECGQFTTARSLLADILMELGVRKPKGTVVEMIAQAVGVMASDRQRPVIVDEAHYVAHRNFVNVLGELHRKSTAPVILIGEETLPQQLERFERVHNCILEWLPAVEASAKDFEALLKYTYEGLSLADDLKAAISEGARGNVRRIIVNLERAAEIARINGGMVTLEAFGGVAAIHAGRTPQPRRASR